MADEPDVTQADSSPAADTTPPQGDATGPGGVSPDQGHDRPVQNVVAEMNRKFGRLQEQIQTLTQYVAATAQQRGAPAADKGNPSEDELWTLAQQGDRKAFEIYMERIADRKSQQQLNALEHSRQVDAQLQTLATRYPVFNDAQHPLTQTVNAAYSIMVQQGYPATRATLLDAMKTAIADRPDLVSAIHSQVSQARDATRVSAARRAQAGQTGVVPRETSTPARATVVNAEQAKLAQRMGIKDPAKSIEKFKQRQETGQSALGAVASIVREEEL